ncbi:ComF family protein [Streptomyces sp. NPDC020141]|uniref:ComF family protein n=1 Tax=Streptomyces sp. NPDC020141 TaxID=3365065 RepID=UPI0037951C20
MGEWIHPLHQALVQSLGIAEQTDPRRYLHIPRNFSDDDAEIRVDLPVHLRFSRDVIADIVTQKPALEGVSFSWHPAGAKPYVLVKPRETPRSANRTLDEKCAAARAHAAALAWTGDTGDIEGATILLVDDVFTTGSQLQHVACRLRSTGAADVRGLVLARVAWSG